MKKVIVKFLMIAFCFTFVGCGTTKIITDQNIYADIYLNGIKKGQKAIEIQRRGVPKKIELTAKYKGQLVGHVIVKRKFDWSTFLIGYFTYGIGFITAWNYPEIIIIPTKNLNDDSGSSPWDSSNNSLWMNPYRISGK
jgi:hypothetical protein